MNLLIWPAPPKERGSGHLRRCVSLREELDAHLYLPSVKGADGLIEDVPKEKILRTIGDITARPWDMIILDNRLSEPALARTLASRYHTVGLDEGDKRVRGMLPFLIDTLPLPPSYGGPNISSHSFLPLPALGVSRIPRLQSVLVTFGGEDREGLGLEALSRCLAHTAFKDAEFTLITGIFDSKNGIQQKRR